MNINLVAPQLRTVDLEKAIKFYTDKLGFDLAFQYEDFYAGISFGEYVIHLKLVDSPDPSINYVHEGKHLHLHLGVEDIQSTYDSLEKKGVTIIENISKRPWGLLEFVIADPDGHTIYFAQNPK